MNLTSSDAPACRLTRSLLVHVHSLSLSLSCFIHSVKQDSSRNLFPLIKRTNSVDFSPQANSTDSATTTGW
jgi:hypothetical protein